MKAKLTVVASSVVLLLGARPLIAHHSVAAEFDADPAGGRLSRGRPGRPGGAQRGPCGCYRDAVGRSGSVFRPYGEPGLGQSRALTRARAAAGASRSPVHAASVPVAGLPLPPLP